MKRFRGLWGHEIENKRCVGKFDLRHWQAAPRLGIHVSRPICRANWSKVTPFSPVIE
jgi:hypothetical protein